MVGHDLLGAAMEIACTAVVTQTTPQAKNFVLRGGRQGAHIRKPVQKARVVVQYRGDLGLLQHDLRQPYPVGISGLLPGQMVTPMYRLPSDYPLGHTLSGFSTHAETGCA